MKLISLFFTVILLLFLIPTDPVIAAEPFLCKTTLPNYHNSNYFPYKRFFGVKLEPERLLISPERPTENPIANPESSPTPIEAAFAQYLAQDDYLNLYFAALYTHPPFPHHSYQINSLQVMDLCSVLFNEGPASLFSLEGTPLIIWPFHGYNLYHLNTVSILDPPPEAQEGAPLHPSALIQISDPSNGTALTLLYHTVNINAQNTHQLQVFEGHHTSIQGMTAIADTQVIPSSSETAEELIQKNNGEFIRNPENADELVVYNGPGLGYGPLIINSKGSSNQYDGNMGNALPLIQKLSSFIDNLRFPLGFGPRQKHEYILDSKTTLETVR